MPKRINDGASPDGAFVYWCGLGDGRSFGAVAERFDVLPKTVARWAAREGWERRYAEASGVEVVEKKSLPSSMLLFDDPNDVAAVASRKDYLLRLCNRVEVRAVETLEREVENIVDVNDAREILAVVREVRDEVAAKRGEDSDFKKMLQDLHSRFVVVNVNAGPVPTIVDGKGGVT